MEDVEKRKRLVYIFVVIIIIVGLIVGGYFIYNYYMTKTNTEKFINYLTSHGYEKKDGDLYIKNDDDISYYFLKNDNAISKIFTVDDGDTLYNYSIDPIKDTYELTLELKGSYDGVYGLSEQKMIYDKKSKEYECKIISNQNFPPLCKEMKKEMDTYIKEVSDLVKASGADEKYILNK